MKNKIFLALVSFTIVFSSCSNEKENLEQNYKNINLTILIDLSDRISENKNPDQVEKDLYIINSVVDAFKKYLYRKGVVQSDDKIKVIFYPVNTQSIYQEIADSLHFDFEQIDLKDRKKIFSQLNEIYNKHLTTIYSIASKAKSYPGSDLFNYFKHRIVDDCILNDSRFINFLVILTDGYIYDENAKYNMGNRFSYLAPLSSHITQFRKIINWEADFDRKDFGLIKLDNDLSKLHILVAELNPPKNHPEDFDILKKYWSKWLIEQNVRKENFKIIKTDLNYLNSNIVQKFFEDVLRRNNAF
ncbi:MAG: hypothetical protein N3F03_05425 [Ignavibacteria bacterium]|nr:hypothetical protein [Ignavibacteria bacterium]